MVVKDKWVNELFLMQPFEVMPFIFDYFSAVLKNAPQEKVDEFFAHFRSGVIDAINARKSESNAELKCDAHAGRRLKHKRKSPAIKPGFFTT